MALARIAEAYVKAVPSLTDTGKAAMNLPYLCVTPEGSPTHLALTLTPASIAALLQRDEGETLASPAEPSPVAGQAAQEMVPVPPAQAGGTAPDAPKKRGWWPFR